MAADAKKKSLRLGYLWVKVENLQREIVSEVSWKQANVPISSRFRLSRKLTERKKVLYESSRCRLRVRRNIGRCGWRGVCPHAIVGGGPVKWGGKRGRAKCGVPGAVFLAGVDHVTYDALSRTQRAVRGHVERPSGRRSGQSTRQQPRGVRGLPGSQRREGTPGVDYGRRF
jgi:hypothetical protein